MQVTGKNLLNVCKLLFSLAKDESNDQLFKVEFIAGTHNLWEEGIWIWEMNDI